MAGRRSFAWACALLSAVCALQLSNAYHHATLVVPGVGICRMQPITEKRKLRPVVGLRMSASADDDGGLRTMFSPPWACMATCGACCYLAPQERDLSGLSPEDEALYVSMAAEDGWCKNFDKDAHLCTIYEDRPGFCRIESLGPMYDVPEEELGDFAADSCRDHIDQLYGEESPEIERFELLQDNVREAAGWMKMEEEDQGEKDEDEAVQSTMSRPKSRKEELVEARRQLVLALDSVTDEDGGTQGLREMMQQLDSAIAAIDTD